MKEKRRHVRASSSFCFNSYYYHRHYYTYIGEASDYLFLSYSKCDCFKNTKKGSIREHSLLPFIKSIFIYRQKRRHTRTNELYIDTKINGFCDNPRNQILFYCFFFIPRYYYNWSVFVVCVVYINQPTLIKFVLILREELSDCLLYLRQFVKPHTILCF